MPNFYSAAMLLAGIKLIACCGSDLGHRIGLHGADLEEQAAKA